MADSRDSASRYNVIFAGELREGFLLDEVKEDFAKLFSLSAEKVEQIFNAAQVTIKKNVDADTAEKFRQALNKVGMAVNLEPLAPPEPEKPTLSLEPIEEDSAQAEPAGADHPSAAASGRAATTAAASTERPLKGSRISSSAEARAAELEQARDIPFQFSGNGTEYFKIWIVNLALTILTLGIYSAWAKVRNKRYFYGHTTLDDTPFEYTAEPLQILKGRLIAVALLLLYIFGSSFSTILGIVLPVLLMAVFPAMLVLSMRFNARNSRWRGVPMQFTGRFSEAYLAFLLWPLAGSITLGILFPYAYYQQQKFLVNSHGYGTTGFDFHAGAGDYYRFMLIGIGLFIVGGLVAGVLSALIPFLGPLAFIGLYLWFFAYFTVHATNLRYNSSTLKDHGFTANWEVPSYLGLVVTNTLATICTLGVFYPWAMVRLARYKAEHLELNAVGDLDAFVAAEERDVSAFGQEMGDVFDFDIGL